MTDDYKLADWAALAEKLTEDELLELLTEGEPEAWRVMAALGFLALQRGEIGLHQIQALTSAGMDVLSLSMFDDVFGSSEPGDDLIDLLDE
jgi:hypothetical protein